MAVPTALATNIRYKGTDYPFGTPIVFTELQPTIEITFDVADTSNIRVITSNGLSIWADGYKYRDTRGNASPIDSLSYKEQFTVPPDVVSFAVYGYNEDGAGSGRTWSVSVDLTTGAEDSWQYLAGVILKDTLEANLTASELTTITENSIIKIFWEGADEEYAQPYILTQTITGGDLNSSQVAYAEMLWRVVVHTPSLATAGLMENAIHKALARKTPVINFSDVYSAGEIEEVTPVTDRYQVQNVPLYVSGGIYRLRITKE